MVLLLAASLGAPLRARPLLMLRGGSAPSLLDSLNTVREGLHRLESAVHKSREVQWKMEPILADPEPGDRVRVRRDVSRPHFEWGEGVSHASIGIMTWCSGDRCRVDFPRHHAPYICHRRPTK